MVRRGARREWSRGWRCGTNNPSDRRRAYNILMRTTFQKAAAAALLSAATLIAQEPSVSDTVKLQKMAARFAPTDIGADVSRLSPAGRRVLAKLVEASKIVDALFLRQVWAGHDAMLP